MKSKTHAIRIISGLMIPIVMSLGSCAVPASDDTDQAETYSTEARLDESFVMQEATDKTDALFLHDEFGYDNSCRQHFQRDVPRCIGRCGKFERRRICESAFG